MRTSVCMCMCVCVCACVFVCLLRAPVSRGEGPIHADQTWHRAKPAQRLSGGPCTQGAALSGVGTALPGGCGSAPASGAVQKRKGQTRVTCVSDVVSVCVDGLGLCYGSGSVRGVRLCTSQWGCAEEEGTNKGYL